jgi:hypothetical protein
VEKRAELAEQRNIELGRIITDLTQKLNISENNLQSEQIKSEQNRRQIERIRAILDENGGAKVGFLSEQVLTHISRHLTRMGQVAEIRMSKRPRTGSKVLQVWTA